MHNRQLTDKEIDLIDHVRREINVVLYKDFSQSGAEKLYELIRMLINPEPQKFICLSCRKKYELYEAE